MKAILLNKEQADKVRGRHGRYSELQPVITDNGYYILPIEVMKDPEHAEVLSELGKCKFTEIDIIQVIDVKLSKDDPFRKKQVLSVKEISPVNITTETMMEIKPIYEIIINPIIK